MAGQPEEPPLVPPEGDVPWANLKNHLRDQRGWIYRGHRRLSWRLETSLERAVENGARVAAERKLLFDFQSAIRNYLRLEQLPDGRLEELGAMQHHGAPTRLLDFTRSPYVATYFAVEDVSHAEPCCVWAIDERWLHDRASELVMDTVVPKADLATGLLRWLYLSPGEWPSVKLVAPAGMMRMSSRQVAQQALFVILGDVSLSFEANLLEMADRGEIQNHVKCFSIPAGQRGEILRDLRLMNISRASLFPGLDGFAQSLRYSLVDEDPAMWGLRVALRGKGGLTF